MTKDGYIIIGSKPYTKFQFNTIIDSFNKNCRCNMALPNNNNGTLYDEQILNCHVSKNIIETPLPLDRFIEFYSKHCTADISKHFYNTFDKNNYNKIMKQDLLNPGPMNQLLENMGCPYKFKKMPRVGFNVIYNMLKDNVNYKVYLANWTINPEEKLLNYHHINESISECHDKQSELKVLRWLHTNKFIDATLCALEDEPIPTIN